MPRIELLPPDWKKIVAAGDGTPTEDVCTPCATAYDEGDEGVEFPGHPDPVKIGSTETCHPPYEDDGPYQCAICDTVLTDKDD